MSIKPVHFVLLAAFAMFLMGCYPEPVASFNFSYSDDVAPASVSFSNLSTDADEYRWDFGDGNTSTSTSPTHTYNEGGNYSITLTATGKGGESSMTKSITIIDPTSYVVKNSSSVTLYSVMSFYWTGSDIIEEVDHGTLSSGSQSSEVITERLTIDVAFQFYYNGVLTLALVYDPYDLTANYRNTLSITDNTTLYIGSAQAKNINSLEDLEEFKKNATPLTLKDIMVR